jgi:DNA-binding XRE family transcriptional regulator
VPIRRNRIDDAARRARQQLVHTLADVRNGRLKAGISQESMAALLGCSRQLIGAIEAGRLEDVGCIQLARMGAVVGIDVPIRGYAAGSPLRDAAQLRLLQRFRASLGDAWAWKTEAPVSGDPLDRRAIDAILTRDRQRVGIEAVTRILDAQGQVRPILLKQEAAELERMVLVLADTRHNRTALIDGAPTLHPAFPLASRELMRDLRAGRLPSANGIVLV